MKTFYFIASACLFPFLSFAQTPAKTVKINTIEKNTIAGFLYPEYEPGKVISPDGTYGKALLNFNCITKEMLFISPKGDTLKISHPETLAMVTIATDTFCYFQNTFLKKATHFAAAPDLFQKMDLKSSYDEEKGAYGYSAITGGTGSGTFVSRGGTTYIEEDKNLVYKRSEDMLVSDGKGKFLPVKQNNFYKLFPQFKNELKSFATTNNTNFDKMKDVISYIEYIQTLQNPVAPK
jgi:hypothetical protein